MTTVICNVNTCNVNNFQRNSSGVNKLFFYSHTSYHKEVHGFENLKLTEIFSNFVLVKFVSNTEINIHFLVFLKMINLATCILWKVNLVLISIS